MSGKTSEVRQVGTGPAVWKPWRSASCYQDSERKRDSATFNSRSPSNFKTKRNILTGAWMKTKTSSGETVE